MRTLSDFITDEQKNYYTRDKTFFAQSLLPVLRYHEFILINAERFKETSKRMVSIIEKLKSLNNEGLMEKEEMKLIEDAQKCNTFVRLEIESFYLFAKILLDKIAIFINNYFGQTHGISLASHDKLTKKHKQYGSAKGLVYPDGFSESITFLKEHVCNYRDKQISHLNNPRSIKGTIIKARGQISISATHIYPKPSELNTQVESDDLLDLLNAIYKYIHQVIKLIEMNRDKSRYTLKN